MLTPVYSGRIPGDYFTLALCQGVRSPANTRPVLVAGQIETDGEGVATVVELCTSPEDARRIGGSGSGLCLTGQAVFRGGPTAIVYVVPVGAGTGTAGIKAIVLGGIATAAGTLQVQIGNTIAEIAVEVGDDQDDIGADIAAMFALPAAFPTQADAPATAGFVTPNLTYTAKDLGIDSVYVRYAFRNIPAGLTVAGAGIDVESTIAAGTLLPAYSAAFAAAFANGMPAYDFVVPATTDPAVITVATTGLKARITTNAGATIMRQMNGVLGCNTTLADSTTLSAALDDGGTGWDEPGWRWQVVWASNNWALPHELAGTECGIRATRTAVDRNVNWCTKRGVKMPGITPCSSVAGYPTFAEIEAALTSGVTPIRYERSEYGFQYGLAFVVRPITAKFSTGGTPDLRGSDTNIPDVAEAVAMGMNQYAGDQFNDCTLTDDTDDGVPPSTLPEKCFTPSMKRSKMIARYYSYYCDRLGWCEKFYRNDVGELTEAAELFICERDPTDATATNDRIPILVRRWHMKASHEFMEFGSA